MNAFLEQRIKSREQKRDAIAHKIRELQRERREIDAELRAYLDVLDNLKSGNEHGDKPEASPEATAHTKVPRMSETWKSILTAFAHAYPGALSVDDVRNLATSTGREMSDETLRSQLSVYTSRDFLERTGVGQYRISKNGAEIMRFNLNSQASSETEEDDENLFG